jgi:hypothetical protein
MDRSRVRSDTESKRREGEVEEYNDEKVWIDEYESLHNNLRIVLDIEKTKDQQR